MAVESGFWDRPDGWTLDDAYQSWLVYSRSVTNPPAADASQSDTLTAQEFNWDVAAVIEEIGSQYGISLSCENIDDECFGCVIDQEKTLVQFLQQHSGPYNYQIVDGDPVRLVRRPINDGLTVDGFISQSDCVPMSNSGATALFSRLDPASLPREVEIAYMDPERALNISTQVARYPGAPLNVARLSASIDFVISPDAARSMAYEWLYRIWAAQLSVSFQVPVSKNIYEPGDVIAFSATSGRAYTLLIQDSVITSQRTNMMRGTVLLTRGGFTVTGGVSSSITGGSILSSSSDDYTDWIVTV